MMFIQVKRFVNFIGGLIHFLFVYSTRKKTTGSSPLRRQTRSHLKIKNLVQDQSVAEF